MSRKYELLRAVVGSQAHGLATAESDTDYRGVFITPTVDLLTIGPKPHTSSWTDGSTDDVSYEVGHFLLLATKSNPSVLEIFRAPRYDGGSLNPWASRMLDLFRHVWSSTGVFEAFRGYGRSQRTKLLANQGHRGPKYAVAWLRTLYNGTDLLRTGEFTLSVAGSPLEGTLRRWKLGESAIGGPLTIREVTEVCEEWEGRITEAFRANPDKKTGLGPVNDYLLDLRREFWT